jgi:hypothetical protein
MGCCGISVVDVLDPEAPEHDVAALLSIHLRQFPDYKHVVQEIADLRRAPKHDGLRHAWLLKLGAQAIGEVLFHSVPQRGVVLMHFVVIEEEHRKQLPLGWFAHLIDTIGLTAEADLRDAGSQAKAIIAEVDKVATSRWERAGFVVLPIDYLEPHHGMHWREYGEPTFFPMTPVLRPIRVPEGTHLGELAVLAVSAFLLDHYALEADHPNVVTALYQARELGQDI